MGLKAFTKLNFQLTVTVYCFCESGFTFFYVLLFFITRVISFFVVIVSTIFLTGHYHSRRSPCFNFFGHQLMIMNFVLLATHPRNVLYHLHSFCTGSLYNMDAPNGFFFHGRLRRMARMHLQRFSKKAILNWRRCLSPSIESKLFWLVTLRFLHGFDRVSLLFGFCATNWKHPVFQKLLVYSSIGLYTCIQFILSLGGCKGEIRSCSTVQILAHLSFLYSLLSGHSVITRSCGGCASDQKKYILLN